MGQEPHHRISKGGHLLEIHQNPSFQAKTWRLQRVGWGLLVLFLLVAALGYTSAIAVGTARTFGGNRSSFASGAWSRDATGSTATRR